MKIISIILTLIIYSNSFSQNYLSNIWYFGGYNAYGSANNAGLDFNNSQVTVISGTGNNGMSTQEGCATITNTNGELIFIPMVTKSGIKHIRLLKQIVGDIIHQLNLLLLFLLREILIYFMFLRLVRQL